MKKLLFAVLWLVIVVPSVFPATINVPGEVSTIQGAISAALDGDTVLVAPGVYYENINFLGKGILVASNFIFDDDTATINATIIDGSDPNHPDTGSAVCFVSGEDSNAVIAGFTIRNGTGTVVDVWRGGGGIYVSNSFAVISSNKIERNRTNIGGGIFCLGGSCKITDNSIIGNYAADGGGIYCDSCPSVLISGNAIKHDTVTASGGGIICGRSTIIISGNEIIGAISLMTGPSYGGAINCGSSSGLIQSNYIVQNSAIHGGGIFCDQCTIDIIGNFLHQNSGLGAICSWTDNSTTIANNVVTDNDRVGILCEGGVGISIVSNTIYGGWYAGIELWGESSLSHISNNIISNVFDGWGIRCGDGSGSGWEISYNDFWNNQWGVFSGCQQDLGDTTWGENINGIPCDSFYNIFRNPLFMNPQDGDFRLLSNSPCIDAGNNAVPDLPPMDYDGNPRIVDGNGDDSAVVDMGAFEYDLNRGDVNRDGVIDVGDVIYLINYLFIDGPTPEPLEAGDANCDGVVDIGDVVYLINYLFIGGSPPC